jgi:hypothetical protein
VADESAGGLSGDSEEHESAETTHDSALTPIRREVDPTSPANERPRQPSLTSNLALLGLLLGGAYIALGWLRRRQGPAAVRPEAIELLASRRLDPHATLHLVRIGQRVLALSSAPGGSRTLAVIDDPEEIAALMSSSTADGLGESDSRGRPFCRRRAPQRNAVHQDSPTSPHAAFGASERPG